MRKQALFLSFFSSFFLLCLKALGQSSGPDSAAVDPSVTQARERYYEAIGVQAHLYSGTEYVEYDLNIKGHPYFETSDWEEGSLYYEGLLYEHVPLLYDILKDEVIIQHYDKHFKIKLLPERVRSFALLGHTFVRVAPDSTQTGQVAAGFYDQLYKGKVQVLAKHVKNIQQSPKGLEKEFLEKKRYFVWKANVYYPVKSKGSVLKVFKDQKKALLKHLREKGIRFNTNYEQALAQTAAYYDALGN